MECHNHSIQQNNQFKLVYYGQHQQEQPKTTTSIHSYHATTILEMKKSNPNKKRERYVANILFLFNYMYIRFACHNLQSLNLETKFNILFHQCLPPTWSLMIKLVVMIWWGDSGKELHAMKNIHIKDNWLNIFSRRKGVGEQNSTL